MLSTLAVDTDDVLLKAGRTSATILPNATTAETTGVGHRPDFLDPATLNDLALKFFGHHS